MADSEGEYLLLKWGTLKGWNINSEATLEIIKQYFADGIPMGAMTDRPDVDRKEILCRLIDAIDGPIENDWTGETMTPDAAKQYVREYGQRT